MFYNKNVDRWRSTVCIDSLSFEQLRVLHTNLFVSNAQKKWLRRKLGKRLLREEEGDSFISSFFWTSFLDFKEACFCK